MQSVSFERALTAALALVLILAGCATPAQQVAPPVFESTDASLAPGRELERAGKYLEAALWYARQATGAPTPRRQELQLASAAALVEARQYAQARLVAKDIRSETLNEELSLRLQLLNARIALAERRPEEALLALAKFKLGPSASGALRLHVTNLRLAALELADRPLEAARERVYLETLLNDDMSRRTNQEAILRLLTAPSEQRLRRALADSSSPALNGWIELALLQRDFPDPARRPRQLSEWRSRYPQHPVQDDILKTIVPQREQFGPRLDHIALLLPLEGPFAKAAGAVRDGFLAAYYAQDGAAPKPQIRLYDTAKGDIAALYQRAVDEGATLVVGPLEKEAVAALARIELPAPALALNFIDDAIVNPGLYQFGLAPEDEARQAAERAWADGKTLAAALYPEGAWGERVFAAFRQRYEQLGGKVIEAQSYNQDKNDFSNPIRKMLQMDLSEARYRDVLKFVRQELRFEPRRRQDIDFIFMAAFPRQARLIRPQLEFFQAADVPIYATSHSYSGAQDRAADRDMNGVIIGDMPWVLDEATPVRERVGRLWPDNAGQLARLYALGVDAYNVLYYLDWLHDNQQAQLRGATGLLYMDAANQIHRRLTWAQFQAGLPQVLASVPLSAGP